VVEVLVTIEPSNRSLQRRGWELSSGGDGQVTISWVARRDYSAPAAR